MRSESQSDRPFGGRCPVWSEEGQPVSYPALKCATDKAVAALLILLSSPIFFIVLAALALDMLLVARDRGSWLCRERRISRGREFDLLKVPGAAGRCARRDAPSRCLRASGGGRSR
jgi:hypothetical protein